MPIPLPAQVILIDSLRMDDTRIRLKNRGRGSTLQSIDEAITTRHRLQFKGQKHLVFLLVHGSDTSNQPAKADTFDNHSNPRLPR